MPKSSPRTKEGLCQGDAYTDDRANGADHCYALPKPDSSLSGRFRWCTRRLHTSVQRTVYDSSLILDFTTGRLADETRIFTDPDVKQKSSKTPLKNSEYPVFVANRNRGTGEITRSQRTDLSPHSSWRTGFLGFKSRRPDVNFGKRTGCIGHSSRIKQNSRGPQNSTNPRSG